MTVAARRRWPWRCAAVLVVLGGLYAMATFSFLAWFALGMRAFDGNEPQLGDWVLVATVDVASVAFVAWAANVLWRRG